MRTSLALLTSLVVTACVSPDPIQITIQSAGGTDRHELTGDELAAAVAAPVPVFQVDGKPSTDPAQLLSGTHLELPLPDHAGTLVATRVDNTLHAEGIDITWNAEHSSLQVITPGGEIAIDVEGVASSRDRDRLAGRLIETFVGADTGSTDLLKADGGVTIAVILAVSYIGCLTGGNYVCADTASSVCGDSGVDEYKMICGAGFDVEGSFKLGMSCSFRCKP